MGPLRLKEMSSSFELADRFNPSCETIWDKSLSVSLTRPLINCWACRVASADPLIIIWRSPWPFCFSTSIWAPEISRTAFILQPPLPMTLLIALAGTETFLDRLTTSFQPSSLFWPFLRPMFWLLIDDAPLLPTETFDTDEDVLLVDTVAQGLFWEWMFFSEVTSFGTSIFNSLNLKNDEDLNMINYVRHFK